MRLYRVVYTYVAGNSAGFSWHANKREAMHRAAEYLRNHRGVPDKTASAMIEERFITRTRAGIVEFLNDFAAHADNG